MNLVYCLTRSAHLPLRLRKKVGKLLKSSFSSGDEFSIETLGFTYVGTHGNHMDDKIFLYGSHEPSTVRLMQRILEYQGGMDRTPILFDVGCNAGFLSMACSSQCVRVVGFEPWGRAREKARKNIEVNNIENMNVLNFALSKEDAWADFAEPNGDNLGVGTLAFDAVENEYGSDCGVSTEHLVSVKTRSGDSFVSEVGVAPSLIKIDVEGAEKDVLHGFQETINSRKPAVIFEYSSVSKRDFPSLDALYEVFPSCYSFWGILPSRERPKLQRFKPLGRYENVLAWPEQQLPRWVGSY